MHHSGHLPLGAEIPLGMVEALSYYNVLFLAQKYMYMCLVDLYKFPTNIACSHNVEYLTTRYFLYRLINLTIPSKTIEKCCALN